MSTNCIRCLAGKRTGPDLVCDLCRVFVQIKDERDQQDRRFGGPQHDDTHTPGEWIAFIRKHAGQAEVATPTDYRYQLVRIAALAIAAAQSFDRRRGS